MEEISMERLQVYQTLFNEYQTRIMPNRKCAEAVITYLQKMYPTIAITNAEWEQMICMEILENEFSAEKVVDKANMQVQLFEIQKQGTGTVLYELQDHVFQGSSIVVGIELSTGYLHVEGSSYLDDLLFLYCGLDEQDIENYVLVGRYITLLQANENGMKTICPECYSANNHITPLRKPSDCLHQHTQYICGSCGRCICMEHDQTRGLQRWNFPFTSLDAAILYVRVAMYTMKKPCGIYEISNAKGRKSYKIFIDEEALLLYIEKHKDKRCATMTPVWHSETYREFENTEIRKLTAMEIDAYLAKRG